MLNRKIVRAARVRFVEALYKRHKAWADLRMVSASSLALEVD
jgi:head-tail adaptor